MGLRLFLRLRCAMANRLRGRAGVEQRKRRLAAEPLCRICSERGVITPSTVPDHIIPLAKGGTDDDANIRCLCDRCHRAVTAEQFGHERWAGLGACDANGLPTDPAHPWAIATGSHS
jgi:5-methylcytosine-specific restriction enzyme A